MADRLAALWERYLRVRGLEEYVKVNWRQAQEMQTAYYAGAGSVMDILSGMIDDQGDGPHPTPAGLHVIEELVAELERYQQDWLARNG